MKLRSIICVAALTATTVLGSASTAQALSWASSSSPLTVTGYGSYGWGYGSWGVSSGSDGTRSRLGANVALSNADNHKVFAKLRTNVNAGYCATTPYLSCTSQYFTYDEADTARHNAYSWAYKSTTTGVPGNADYARAGIQTRLDIPAKPDVGSGWWWTNGVKY